MDASANQRRALRLRSYDYRQPGAYFITLCVQDRVCLFGDVTNGIMHINECGRLIHETWLWLAKQYTHVSLDEFIVMPNHLHGIVMIDSRRGGSRAALSDSEGRSRATPTKIKPEKIKPLGSLIGAYKTVSGKAFNSLRNTPSTPLWQRNYYEHVIRNDMDLQRIREYIQNNPAQWALDKENPDRAR